MKTSELMIGDLLHLNRRPVRVDAIGFNGSISYSEKGGFGGIGIDKLSPIPITKEILEKNGFVKTWNGDWQLKEYATIIISKDYYVKIFERSIRIDYVHELQHMLYAACVDKELVID